MFGDGLRLIARHGRLCLVLGLLAGFTLPSLAAAMKPALPALVAGLVFLTALRIGHRSAFGSLRQARASLGLVMAFQVAVPVLAITGLNLGGVNGTAAGLAVVLALAAPSVSGGPMFTALLGYDPAPAMRLLILGTALLPLTVIPVFWLVPSLGGLEVVIAAALRLTIVIAGAAAAGFVVRRLVFSKPSKDTIAAFDGLAAVVLAIIVVGLMSAVGPALHSEPAALAGWLALACLVNFGMQVICFTVHCRRGQVAEAVPVSVVAGNRNIALFLVALPTGITDPVLTFIGCYQVPMYLTPILMRHIYGAPPAHA
ncbi:MAG: hypothetical protein AAGF74_00710 [Pseudomonadota bacterium]